MSKETQPLGDAARPSGPSADEAGESTAWIGGERKQTDDPLFVGRFVVLDQLGRGAMGRVLLAYDPKLLREVALKLMSTGGAEASARMLREAQALAQLSHPNVVGIYDVGEQDGDVFIAMEYVRGQTLREWLAGQTRPWRQIVAAIRDAGRGLAAAHRVGLVHRDVKPDNILVAEDGRVRVADFGLARVEQPIGLRSGDVELSGDPLSSPGGLVTEAGTVLGTLAYMAPEQHTGAVADAASDQYALCVTLYEALFHERPFGGRVVDLLAAKQAGVTRVAARTDVPRVITRAVLRGLAPLPGDRWPSIDALLDELGRDPRRARVRAMVAVGGLATIATVYGVQQLDRQRISASCASEGETIAEVWNDEVRQRVHDGVRATQTRAAEFTATQVLPWIDGYATRWQAERTEACLDGRLRGTWSTELLERAQWCFDDRRNELEAFAAELATADAEVVHLAVAAAAGLTPVESCRDTALLTRLPTPPTEQRDAVREVRAAIAKAWALGQAGRYAAALTSARTALEGAEALAWPPLVAAARYRVAIGLSRTGELTEAESLAEDAYVVAASSGSWDVALDASDQLVWTAGTQLGHHTDALRWSRMRDVAAANLGHVDELREARHQHRVAFVHFAAGDHAKARALHERALATFEARLGPEHPDVAAVLFALASSHHAAGEYPQAKVLHERALAVREQALGKEHPDVGQSLVGLASVYIALGDLVGARSGLERARSLFEHTHGPNHPATAIAVMQLGQLDAAAGDYASARRNFEHAVEVLEKAVGRTNADVAKAMRALANVHAITGDLATARQLNTRALAVSESLLGPDHVDIAVHLDDLAVVEGMSGQYARATELHERALRIVETALGPDNPRVVMILDNLAADYTATGRFAEARKLLERSLEVKRRVFDPTHFTVAYSLVGLGDLDLQEGQPAKAAERYEQALEVQGVHATPPLEVAQVRFKLAQALWPADRGRALAQAERAKTGLAKGAAEDAMVAEIDAWIAAHPRR